MKTLWWIVLFVSMLVWQPSIASHVVAAGKIKYGEWQVDIDMTGLPIGVPTQTQRICLKKNNLASGSREQQGCKVNWILHGHTVSWTIQCSNGSHGKGAGTYKRDTFKGYNELIMPGGFLSLQSTLTGKWIRTNCSAQSLR